ncbi:MAG: hypothetical protein ACLRXQ_06710 [Phascolarctobacterium faecium]
MTGAVYRLLPVKVPVMLDTCLAAVGACKLAPVVLGNIVWQGMCRQNRVWKNY